MGQKRSYRQYPQAFKEEAVALVKEQGYSVAEDAKSLGIATNILYRWKDKCEQQRQGEVLAVDQQITLPPSATSIGHQFLLQSPMNKGFKRFETTQISMRILVNSGR